MITQTLNPAVAAFIAEYLPGATQVSTEGCETFSTTRSDLEFCFDAYGVTRINLYGVPARGQIGGAFECYVGNGKATYGMTDGYEANKGTKVGKAFREMVKAVIEAGK